MEQNPFAAQRFAFAKHGAGAGVDSAWEQKKLEATLREVLAVGAAVPSVQCTSQIQHSGAVLGSALTRHLAQLRGDVGNPATFHKICPCVFHP